jgi:UDP-2,3-diacylglucosamine pyrophosphatase LpxH
MIGHYHDLLGTFFIFAPASPLPPMAPDRKKPTRLDPRRRPRGRRRKAFSQVVRRWVDWSRRVRRSAREFLDNRRARKLVADDRTPPADGKCYFVADLHLFANRSKGVRHFDELLRKASQAQYFVFGGDIFDFRWAQTKSHAQTVERASVWLMALGETCPQCRFHYVLGNHDYHRQFIDRLYALDLALPNFSWHRFYVRIGNSVFLHGDVADGEGATPQSLAESRQLWLDRRRRGPWMSSLYDAVVLARLHKPLPHLVYTKRLVAQRISDYLENIGQGPDAGVRNVYFGHTHLPMVNYHYGRLVFHNGGAGIKGMKFRILDAVTE